MNKDIFGYARAYNGPRARFVRRALKLTAWVPSKDFDRYPWLMSREPSFEYRGVKYVFSAKRIKAVNDDVEL